MARAASIDVCVCTYRRPSLAATLQSIASQVLPAGLEMRVIVVDNDDTPSARDLVTRACQDLGLTFLYLHAPARNISIARNACLAHADAALAAFIDDDETAGPGWLAALIGTLDSAGADVVFGPVQAVYEPASPAWLRQADLHSTRPAIGAGAVIQTGYTCQRAVPRANPANRERAAFCRIARPQRWRGYGVFSRPLRSRRPHGVQPLGHRVRAGTARALAHGVAGQACFPYGADPCVGVEQADRSGAPGGTIRSHHGRGREIRFLPGCRYRGTRFRPGLAAAMRARGVACRRRRETFWPAGRHTLLRC